MITDENKSNNKKQAFYREIINRYLAKRQWFMDERARRIQEFPQILLDAQAEDEAASDPLMDNASEVKVAHADGLTELDSEVSAATRAIEEAKEEFRNDFGKDWND